MMMMMRGVAAQRELAYGAMIKGKERLVNYHFKELLITKEQSIPHEGGAGELDEAPTIPQSKPDLVDPLTVDTPDDPSKKKSRITVRSADFDVEVLNPRRVKIGSTASGRIRDPYKHFNTDFPRRGEVVDYTILEGIEASQIWLSLSDDSVEKIIEEYQAMGNEAASEAEYAAFAMEKFFKRQDRHVNIPSDRMWRTRRTISLFCPPDDSDWFTPPSFEMVQREFKFDLRPDCQYWLSLAGFNPKYRGEVGNVVYVHKYVITCPYFTIEFKKQNESAEKARIQAAASASIALYNRFLLKEKALNATSTPWTDSHKNQVRHYVITFVGSKVNVWILEADFGGDGDDLWNGCSMSVLWQGNCISESVVKQLEKWINEIHRWGLSQHATDCQQDVKRILQEGDVDTSLDDIRTG
jgi:hypothetical protein